MWVDTCIKWLNFALKVADMPPSEKEGIKSALRALEIERRRQQHGGL